MGVSRIQHCGALRCSATMACPGAHLLDLLRQLAGGPQHQGLRLQKAIVQLECEHTHHVTAVRARQRETH